VKVIDPGHEYLAEGPAGVEPQRITFVKNRGGKYPGNDGDPHLGILCQELMRVLIDRMSYLNNQGSCAETEHALAAVRQALGWMEVRAARCRGDAIDLPHADSLEGMLTCPVCGHNCCTRGDHHEHVPGTWRP
jgi:hypothetical protein